MRCSWRGQCREELIGVRRGELAFGLRQNLSHFRRQTIQGERWYCRRWIVTVHRRDDVWYDRCSILRKEEQNMSGNETNRAALGRNTGVECLSSNCDASEDLSLPLALAHITVLVSSFFVAPFEVKRVATLSSVRPCISRHSSRQSQ